MRHAFPILLALGLCLSACSRSQDAGAPPAAAPGASSSLVSIDVISKEYVPAAPASGRVFNELTFVFAVKNNSAKDIAAVTGTLQFSDLSGAAIKSVPISLDTALAANMETMIPGFVVETKDADDSDQKLVATELGKMKAVFTPEMVTYTDGTSEKVSAP